MKDRPRVVIDTNVFVSALIAEDSQPFSAIELAFLSARVLMSAATLAELEDVFQRPKLRRYVSPAIVAVALDRLRAEAEMVAVAETQRRSRDPKDDAFLDLAVAGRADWLVTGDGDLLVLSGACAS